MGNKLTALSSKLIAARLGSQQAGKLESYKVGKLGSFKPPSFIASQLSSQWFVCDEKETTDH